MNSKKIISKKTTLKKPVKKKERLTIVMPVSSELK